MGDAVTERGDDGADAAASVVRLRLDLAYQGTDFSGWSRQPGLRTVQGVLESALATLFRREGAVPRLVVAGRTDAGVHAIAMRAHVDIEKPLTPFKLTEALNAQLRPAPIAIIAS